MSSYSVHVKCKLLSEWKKYIYVLIEVPVTFSDVGTLIDSTYIHVKIKIIFSMNKWSNLQHYLSLLMSCQYLMITLHLQHKIFVYVPLDKCGIYFIIQILLSYLHEIYILYNVTRMILLCSNKINAHQLCIYHIAKIARTAPSPNKLWHRQCRLFLHTSDS